MTQAVSLGAIARAKGGELLAHRSITPTQCKVLRSIADCRTDALGGHRDHCDRCDYEHVFWNSCRDRHCPGCGAEARENWLEKRREEVLDVPYFHVVFTIPESLNVLAHYAPAIVYAILLRAAGQALLDVARTRLRALLGVLAVLHTWGQTLIFHPHIHCIVPGGGFSLDGRRWVRVPTGTFLPYYKALSRRFRTHVKNAITGAFDDGTLILPTSVVPDRQALDLLLALASKTDWHNYVKPPFGGPEQVLAYLAAYTHRVGISNRRILSFENDTVTFAYRDYKDGNAQKTMPLPATEFLARFLQHVVPPRFTRVRYYGFLSNRDRTANIAKARELIGSSRKLRPRVAAPDARLCPQCKQGTLRIRSRIDRNDHGPGSTRHDAHCPRLAFALAQCACPAAASSAPPCVLRYRCIRLFPRRRSPRFQPSSFQCSRYPEALRANYAPAPGPRGPILSPRRHAASSN